MFYQPLLITRSSKLDHTAIEGVMREVRETEEKKKDSDNDVVPTSDIKLSLRQASMHSALIKSKALCGPYTV
jgi:hypothetical protein